MTTSVQPGPLILRGDARRLPIASGVVQCVVTSPPYWGLRDYRVGGQLGLERTPEEYVGNLVAVFDEVRRVLRPDGVVWLNLGDSYVGRGESSGFAPQRTPSKNRQEHARRSGGAPGLKAKDLVGVPWRVALALRAAGWYLRAEVIWQKPQPSPESAGDRPSRSHETVFLLAKSRRYVWNKEEGRRRSKNAGRVVVFKGKSLSVGQATGMNVAPSGNAKKGKIVVKETSNLVTVWTLPPARFPGAHYAVMPTALAVRCIKAGSRRGDLVLDPFGGTGTVALAAESLGRRGITIDLSAESCAMARDRIARPHKRARTEDDEGRTYPLFEGISDEPG